jgi:hypothetical protein
MRENQWRAAKKEIALRGISMVHRRMVTRWQHAGDWRLRARCAAGVAGALRVCCASLRMYASSAHARRAASCALRCAAAAAVASCAFACARRRIRAAFSALPRALNVCG